MQIVLTRTIAENRGWVKGKILDLPIGKVMSMCKEYGSEDWFMWDADFQAKLHKEKLQGTPPPKTRRTRKTAEAAE